MDTLVTVSAIADNEQAALVEPALAHALAWFEHVEATCSRFDDSSEVFRLAEQPGIAVRVSPMLCQVVHFAIQVAKASHGMFDPTIGAAQAERGFDRNYRTGRQVRLAGAAAKVSYRDVAVNLRASTITLRRRLLLDLGAVAKGLAIDLAGRELEQFAGFSIDAGGDILVGGVNDEHAPWRIGIEHPRAQQLIATLELSNLAVCTSGDYERHAPGGAGHHLIDPHNGTSPQSAISCTVVAQRAMLADALSTAALVAGPSFGLRLLEEQGVEGMIVLPDLSSRTTSGFGRYLA